MTTPVLSILDLLHFDCPTQEQKTALLSMAEFVKEENTDDFFILCGAAGTGKSSIMSALVGYLNQRNIAYHIAAPTGRAARIIGRKTATLASTIHSLIYITKPNPETGVVHFSPRPTDDDQRAIYIVDEASMIPSTASQTEGAMFVAPNALLDDLAKHIKACDPKNKIIFLGDRYQLPPVGEQDSYALQEDYLKQHFGWSGGGHVLTEVKRQEDGSKVLKNAKVLREAAERGVNAVLDAPRVGNNAWQTAAHFIANMRANGISSAIAIGRSHLQNQRFNEAVREKRYGNNLPIVKEGELMLVTQNWNRNGHALYNGDHVEVKAIQLDNIEAVGGLHFCVARLAYRKLDGSEGEIEDYINLNCILTKDGKLTTQQEQVLRHERNTKNKRYRESGNPEDDRYIGALRLMYGYAITCNKAQGGEWDSVYVNTFSVSEPKWLYTAATRARTTLIQF